MLYAQVKQVDGKQNRNILLSELRLSYVSPNDDLARTAETFLAERFYLSLKASNSLRVNLDAPSTAIGQWTENEIMALLEQFNLEHDTGLSVLAVEMMPRYDQYFYKGPPVDDSIRPLSRELGQYRILRTSPLAAAPEICCEECT